VFHVSYILSTVIICAFRISAKRRKLKTDASRFADKTVCKTVLQKTQIMTAGSIKTDAGRILFLPVKRPCLKQTQIVFLNPL